MNRRSFFSKFSLLCGAASLSPTIFIPRFEPVRWKVMRTKRLIVPNPDYATARYEVYFCSNPQFKELNMVPSYPARHNGWDENGNQMWVLPFKEIQVPT